MAYSAKIEDFESLTLPWEQLLKGSSQNHVFLTPTWQRVWWEQFGDGWELLLASIRSGEQLVGIAPLMRSNDALSLVGDSDVCDYLDLVAMKGHEEGVCLAIRSLLEELAWESLDLAPLRPDSVVANHLIPLLKENGYAVETTQIDTSPEVCLPMEWEEFLAGLSKKDRHELRRKLRRLERAGEVRHQCARDPDTLSQDLDDFFRLFKASRPDKVEFLTSERETFFREMSSSMMERGYLRLSFLELNGERVSTNLCFEYNNSASLYNSGYDPSYRKLSVGLLLKAHCIRSAIESGKKRFDFLRGAEPYKYDLGGKDVPIYRIQVRRQTT